MRGNWRHFCNCTDSNDLVFIPPTLSACPSLANSPIMSRRDSILKHSGSVKTDKRVSINTEPPKMEFVCEKRPPSSRPASLSLAKGERPLFKLVRSPSIDQDDDSRPDVGHTVNDESVPLVRESESNQ
ncbi:hypothetical protein HA402_001972 [Bradysia odoriphaga]|nr:hypothetical protein HA402_001972 [Bradysia odoriphaga]